MIEYPEAGGRYDSGVQYPGQPDFVVFALHNHREGDAQFFHCFFSSSYPFGADSPGVRTAGARGMVQTNRSSGI